MENNQQLQSALLFLAEKKDLPDAVKLLIQNGVNPNIKTDFENTPLILAALYDNVETVKILLEFGADVNIKNQEKNNALMEMLDNNWINKITPDALRIIEILINAGIDVNATNVYGETPILLAVKKNNFELVKLLLNSGANPNVSFGGYEITPLKIAASNGNFDIVKILLQAGANPNASNQEGETAASMLSEYKDIEHIQIRDLLLKFSHC